MLFLVRIQWYLCFFWSGFTDTHGILTQAITWSGMMERVQCRIDGWAIAIGRWQIGRWKIGRWTRNITAVGRWQEHR